MIQLRQRDENRAPTSNTTKPTPEMMMGLSPTIETKSKVKIKTFSLEEIAKHNTSKDLWMIIHNKVYDVTSIIHQHPGGAEVLFDFAGADGTVSFDDVGHSQDSVEMLRPLFLGIVNKGGKDCSEIELSGTNGREQILMKIDEDFNEELAPGIKYYNILGAESEKNNSSLGQSTYWKRYIQKKKEQKQGKFNYFGVTEKNINIVLIVVAMLAFFGLIYIQKWKTDRHELYHWDDE